MSVWPMKSWEEVLQVKNGKNQKEVENPNGKFPIYGSGGNVMNYSNEFICDEGTIIIGRKGTIDNPLFINHKFWIVDTAFGITGGKELDRKFLYYFCLGLDFRALNKGTTIPSLVKTDLLKIKMPVPPLKEQKQIVSILDEAFEAIDKAKANIEKNIENAKELFQAKLCEVFDSNDSKSWPTSRLIEVCTIKPPKKEASENLDENSLVSFVPMNDLGIDEMFFETKDSKPLKEVQSSYTYFADGDVLLAKITPCFENGKLGIAKNLINGVGFGSSEFVVYRPDKAILSEWLYYFLCQDKFRTEGASRMTGAVGHKRIPKDFYEDALIVLPDIKLQRKIIGNLNQLRANLKLVHNKYENKIQTLSELKKSILQRAFAGELTEKVPA